VIAHSELINMGSWIADTNNKFANMTLEERRQYLGSFDSNYPSFPHNSQIVKDLPVNFDAREKWPNCIHPIVNQGKCGSCWAFAVAEAFGDRVCIATEGAISKALSPQDLVSCDTKNKECHGGHMNYTWDFIVSDGLVGEDCFPYSSKNGTMGSNCTRACVNGEPWIPIYGKDIQTMDLLTARLAIMTNGPIETAFNVYQDFDSYKSGVYVQNSTVLLGGHAVKVLGWGFDEEVGLDYWLAANSWGPDWGMEGYFKIQVGCCGFGHLLMTADYDPSRNSFLSSLFH